MVKVILLFLVGCATVQQSPKKDIYYKRDMKIRVNNKESNGTLVVDRSDKYVFRVWFPGKADLLTFRTCHREWEWEDAGRNEKFNYVPVKGIEDQGYCFAEVAAFEQGKGRHAWAIVDFEAPLFSLPARVKCNGKEYSSSGVELCQSKEGLLQSVEFSERVTPSTTGSCGALSGDGKLYKFKIKPKECTYLFKGESGRLFKLTTIGYEQILIRKLR